MRLIEGRSHILSGLPNAALSWAPASAAYGASVFALGRARNPRSGKRGAIMPDRAKKSSRARKVS